MRGVVLGLAILCGAVAPAAAQSAKSVAGNWDASMATPGGSSSFKLLFRVTGDSVAGTVYRASGEVALKGVTKGDSVRFSYTILYNDTPFALTVAAKVLPDSLSGTVDFDGKGSAAFWATRSK